MQSSTELEYLREVAAKYGNLYLEEEFDAFVEGINEAQLAELVRTYEIIEKKEDAYRISRWMDDCLPLTRSAGYQERRFAQNVGSLFNLFAFLGSKGIAPFASKQVQYIKVGRRPNWDNLPPDLQYLKGPAEKYGRFSSEAEMAKFVESASEEDMSILARTAEQIEMSHHFDAIEQWLKRFPMTQHEEAWLVYSLLGIMDHSGLV